MSKLASRIQFQSIVQHEDQSVDEYLADLRHSSINCGFVDELDNRLKDQFVVSGQIKSRRSFSTKTKHSPTSLRMPVTQTCQSKVTSSKSAFISLLSANQVRSNINQTRFIPPSFQHGSSQSTRFQTQRSLTNYSICMPCYRYGTSRQKQYECSYFLKQLQCNNCKRTGHKALVCCQPRQR